MIQVGDYVLVSGEANEVFQVKEIHSAGHYILDSGCLEDKDKCFKIPDNLLKYIHTKTTRVLSMEFVELI
jgi:hypothetical protein